MPTLCFTSRDGETIERFYQAGEYRPDWIRENGKKYKRDIVAEHRGHKPVPGNWPLENWALGCAPEDSKKLAQEYAKNGVPTEVNEKGNLIIRDKSHYRAVQKLNRVHENNGGY